MNSSFNILDVTIRDGSNLLNHLVSPELVTQVASGLQEANFGMMEISHGYGIGAKIAGFPALVDDEDLLIAARRAAPDLKFSIFISAHPFSLSVLPSLLDYFDLGRVGVDMDHLATADKISAKVKKYDKKLAINLVRAHGFGPEAVAEATYQAEQMGADIIYLVDTFGSFTPDSVKKYFQAMQSKTKLPLGFHGHNHLGLAIPNTLAALDAGAQWIDATLLGVGRGPGNAVLEILINLLQERGTCQSISVERLAKLSEEVILPAFKEPPKTQLIHLLIAKYKMDYAKEDFLSLVASLLHMPLEELFVRLKEFTHESIQVTEEQLKGFVESLGFDWEMFKLQ